MKGVLVTHGSLFFSIQYINGLYMAGLKPSSKKRTTGNWKDVDTNIVQRNVYIFTV